MKHLISLTFSIVFLLLLNACGGGSSSNDGDTSSPENIPPVANAGEDKIVHVNDTVDIIGSGSDTDGSVDSYEWKEDSTVLATTPAFDYIPTTIGIHTLTLTVTDNGGETDSDTMDVNATIFPDAIVHDTSFKSDHFSGSENCAQCHDGISDTSTNPDTDVSIVKAWQGTMMANASIDPLYLAKVASEVNRNPNFKDVIEDKCSRCHMPMANVEAGFTGDAISMSGDGFLNPDNIHYNEAKDGVSCTLCHQIENDPKLGTDEGFSGQFVIADNEDNNRKAYGPYPGPLTGPMTNDNFNIKFTPTYSTHIEDSKLCASCHNLDTPVIDAQGNLNGLTFPEQAVYTEWEYSDFNDSNINTAKSCQACHMPTTEGSVILSTKGSNLTPRPNFHQHKFLGANTYMLEIIKNNSTKLGAIADTARFDESITDTRVFLKAAADVNIINTNFENGTLKFSVVVTNHSGHKFPTSLPSRRAWLHVQITNTANQSVFESGAFNSNGQIIGVDDNTDGYEKHYEKIDNAMEVQVYEPIMADTDGKQTYTFMQASRYLKDNRILPKGFKNTAPANAQAYGEALNDSNFVGGSDTVDYELSLPDADYTITVTLLYQTMSYGFAQDLYKDVDLTEVALMKSLDDTTTNHFETISTDIETVK